MWSEIQRHSDCIDILVASLVNRDQHISREKTYRKYGIEGECDLLVQRNGFTTYYEVKSHHGEAQYIKACHQLRRWHKVNHNSPYCRMVYVGFIGDRIVAKRIYDRQYKTL